MRFAHGRDRYRRIFVLSGAVLTAAPAVLSAAPTWTSGGTSDNWNDADNWNPAGAPTTTSQVIFDDTAQGGDGVNVVDVNFTVQKLSFNTTGTAAFSTTIPTGVLLRVDGDTGGTNNVNQTRDNSDFNVGHDLSNYTGARSIDLTIAGAGSLQIGASSTASTADAVISRRGTSGAGSINVNLNMSGLADFKAYVDEFAVGIGGGANGAQANTTLRLAQNSQILANTFVLGDHTGSGGVNTDGSVLRFGQTTDLRANNIYIGKQKVGATATFDAGLASPTLTIASRSGGAANLFIGYNDNSSTGTTPTSVLDLTNAGGTGTVNLTATLNTVAIGRHVAGAGYGRGELKMNAGAITANTLNLAQAAGTNPQNTHGRLTIGGGSFTVSGDVMDLGGQSFINVTAGAFSSGRKIRVDELNVGVGGGVATLGTALVGGQVNRRISTLQLGENTTWNVRLAGPNSGLDIVNATIDGTLNITGVNAAATPSVVDADRSTWTGETGVWDNSHENWERGLPAGFTIATNQVLPFITTTGTLTNNGLSLTSADWSLAVTPGAAGTATLTRTGAPITSAAVKAFIDSAASVISRPTALRIAEESGADATSIHMTGGSLTVDGLLTLASAGAPGEIMQEGGTITLNAGLADGGAGASNLRVDSGTFSVTGPVNLDRLQFVGTNGRTATFTASGSPVVIDTTANVDVGYRGTDTTSNTVGTLNLSGATSVNITAAILRAGRINVGPASGQASGSIQLSTSGTNTVVANSVILGESANAANSTPTSTLVLGGAQNNFSVDSFIVGGNKSKGHVTIAPGGTLTLGGRTGALTDLLIGENNISTGTSSDGVLNMTGGVFNAALDDLIIGRHGSGSGGAKGTLIMSAGNVSATQILLASANNGGTSSNLANITGTLQLSGGTISAGSVNKGPGAATFDWTGGTLTVGSFGFDLTQNGASSNLSPGGAGEAGTTSVTGGYALTSGRWSIGLDGVTGLADKVVVSGLLDLSGSGDVLDVSLLGGSAAGKTFVIASYGTLSGTFNTENLAALPAGTTVNYAYEGNNIAIVAVPEPATAGLIAVGVGGLLCRRRRRR